MIQAKQDCRTRERAVLNKMKMDSRHATVPHIKTESMCVCLMCVFGFIFAGIAYVRDASADIGLS